MEMRIEVKIVMYSFLGWLGLILSTYILSLIGIANPLFTLEAMFRSYGVDTVYHFQAFGIIFTIWAISATIPIMILNILSSAITIGSIIPFLIFLTVCVVLGFQLRLKYGLISVLILITFGTVIGTILAFLVPVSLPVSGLSPEDQAVIASLGDEFVKLTILTPPNRILDVILTLGIGIAGAVGGNFLYPMVDSRRKKSKPRKRKKAKSTTKPKKANKPKKKKSGTGSKKKK